MTAGFGARLTAAVDALGSLCVGIDPHAALLAAWDLPDTVDGLARFADLCVAAFGDDDAVKRAAKSVYDKKGA